MPSASKQFTDPGLNTGELDQRLTLLKPVYNEWNDEIVSYLPTVTVWGSVDYQFGREQTEAARGIGLTDIVVRIRWGPEIDKRYRLEHRSNTYEVVGILNILARNEQLRLQCKWVE